MSEYIVIIDNDEDDLAFMKEMIEQMQFEGSIMTFDNPLKAVAFLKEASQKPLFILCDINMPRMNGFQLREALLNSVSSVADLPFFFVSTSKSEKEIMLANQLMVSGFYKKAVTFREMKELLQNILSSLNIRSDR